MMSTINVQNNLFSQLYHSCKTDYSCEIYKYYKFFISQNGNLRILHCLKYIDKKNYLCCILF